jgi:hypothetical protein
MKIFFSLLKSLTMKMKQIQEVSKKSNQVHLKDSLKALSSRRIWSIVMCMLIGGNLMGQFGQFNILPGNTCTQNFNGLGASATANLPNAWRVQKSTLVRTIPNFSTSVAAVDLAGGNSISATATNGIYRYNSNNSTSESAIGGLSSASASKTVALYVCFQNIAASGIGNFTISYNVEKYRNGTNSSGFSIELFYSTNGTSWTSCGSNFTTSFAADADNLGYTNAPMSSISITSQTYTPPSTIAQNEYFYFAWRYSVTTGSTTSNAQALGVDDISITANGANPTIASNTTLNVFTTSFGTASSIQTKTISGSNLTANLIATAPTGFEVSNDGTTYGTTAIFIQSGGSASGTLYIRLSATASAGSYNNQNIILSSTGATSVNISTPSSGNIVYPILYTWSGTTSTDWTTATNWNPNGVPDGSIDITIPSSSSLTNSPSIGSLTINAGKTLTLQSGAKLTLSGTLSNNGTVNIENGATLVQTGSGTNSGSGTYNVKQTVSGSGGATPNGRFWYLGSPLSDGSSTALLSSTGNQLWQWNETNVNYAALSSGQTLSQGKSYVLRSGQTTETINFSGTGLSNGTLNILNLSRTGTSAQMRGCHLVSNPYPSYLDWDLVGKTNVSTTMYVRTALGSNFNVLETYNSLNQVGTNLSGIPMTKDIAPMQGFWVKVTTDGQTGSLAMDNSMRSHQANGAGLRSSAQDFPAFLRFNMFDGENKDQVILFMSPDASTSLDEHDSEKMIATGSAQFYSTVNAKKLVINGMKNMKSKTSIPLILDLPTSKSYSFQAEEFNIEDGLILLEDKQEGVIQDLTINPVYSFFGNAGINSTRFVIHFHLPFPAFGTFDFEANELSANNTDLSFETSDITIFSNGKGQISVSLPSIEMKDAQLEVIDASGRTKLKKKLIEKETVTNLDICSGIYYIRVSSSQNIKLQKIFIQPE